MSEMPLLAETPPRPTSSLRSEVDLPPQAGRGRRRKRISPIAWAIAPAALLFILFFILPFAVMATLSLLSGNPVSNPNVTLTFRHYNRLFDSDLYFDALVATLRIGLITTGIALVIGYPLAHCMARMRSRLGHALLLMAVIAPLLTGIVVRTFAWMTLLADRGVINTTVAWLGLADKPLPLMYNEFGVVVGLVHIYVPFMVLTLVGVIGRIDRTLEEAARGLGANRARTFLEVTLPLSFPGILAGSLLVFALAISAYVTPVVLGGNNVLTLPMLIYQQVSASFNLGFAGALGVVLLAVSLVLVFGYNTILGRVTGERQLA
jgi:putative spermidine/putrescine transport system permease protein